MEYEQKRPTPEDIKRYRRMAMAETFVDLGPTKFVTAIRIIRDSYLKGGNIDDIVTKCLDQDAISHDIHGFCQFSDILHGYLEDRKAWDGVLVTTSATTEESK